MVKSSGISELHHNTVQVRNLTKPQWLLEISWDDCAVLKLAQSDWENDEGEENVLTFKTIVLSCSVRYSTFCLVKAFIMRLSWEAAKSRQCLTVFFFFLI